MDFRQALETAAALEREIRNIYKEASAQTDDPAGKRVLNLMAEEEDGHLKYIESKLAALDGAGSAPGPLPENLLPDLAALSPETDGASPRPTPKQAELSILARIRDAEAKTADFYKGVLSTLPEADQPLFRRFAEIEAGHLHLVEAEIDHLTHRGAWLAVDYGELRHR